MYIYVLVREGEREAKLFFITGFLQLLTTGSEREPSLKRDTAKVREREIE